MLVIVIQKQPDPDGSDHIDLVQARGYKIEDGVLIVPERREDNPDDRCFPLVNVREFKVRR